MRLFDAGGRSIDDAGAGGRDAQGLQGGRTRQPADEGDGTEAGGGESR